MENNKELFDGVLAGRQLGYSVHNKDKVYLVLILQKLRDDWVYWETLIHELSHIVDWIVDMKMLDGETEARAYLHEWLFREVRRKLQGIDKI